jgi:hypothetical protein
MTLVNSYMKRTAALAVVLASCSPEAPAAQAARMVTEGKADLPRYFLVGPVATRTLDPDAKTLLPRFGLSVVEERQLGSERVGRTRLGRLVLMRDLEPAVPSTFAGRTIPDGKLDFAWIRVAHATIHAQPERVGKPLARLGRRRLVTLVKRDGPADFYRVSTGEVSGWMATEELAVPSLAPRPIEVGPDERWIDVELASQTLVAYQGNKPQFATLVSTGVGQPGTAFATPLGVHRVRAKLRFATMDNLSHTGVVPYSYEDVPFTQYIGRVALHGVFWHDRFGTTMSHGCINLSLADAEWLFAFTQPELLPGADQVAATPARRGTVVRVR